MTGPAQRAFLEQGLAAAASPGAKGSRTVVPATQPIPPRRPA